MEIPQKILQIRVSREGTVRLQMAEAATCLAAGSGRRRIWSGEERQAPDTALPGRGID